VIGPTGIVGRVVNVSNNFATVMSVLSRQFRVDAKLIKSGERGIVGWDGESTQYVQMRNVPKSTEVKRGDTVMTSELSSIFPANIMVGTVDTFQTDPSSNFYTLKLKTSTNFSTVQYVYVVQNSQLEEQKLLEAATKKTNE